jgi:transcriptional regulator with XRE-family HTH domain
MGRTSRTPKARALGAELRDARERAGIGLRQLARMMEIPHAKLVRWEQGMMAPSPANVATILATIGVNGPERDRLVEMAQGAELPNWYGVGIDETLAAMMEFERTAARIVDVAPLLIPGLLQTSDYARAIMEAAGNPLDEVNKLVALRAGRRDNLTKAKPVPLVAVISESELRQPMGSRADQADQLRHILKFSAQNPNVRVQVLRQDVGWTPASDGPFMLFEFEKAGPIVHLEHHRASGFVHDPGDVAAFVAAATTVRRAALSEDDSAKLIAAVIEEMEGSDGPPPLAQVQS